MLCLKQVFLHLRRIICDCIGYPRKLQYHLKIIDIKFQAEHSKAATTIPRGSRLDSPRNTMRNLKITAPPLLFGREVLALFVRKEFLSPEWAEYLSLSSPRASGELRMILGSFGDVNGFPDAWTRSPAVLLFKIENWTV